jgi:hypothetical protein
MAATRANRLFSRVSAHQATEAPRMRLRTRPLAVECVPLAGTRPPHEAVRGVVWKRDASQKHWPVILFS